MNYREGGFIHLKTGLLDNSIPKNTPEILVSGGVWEENDGETGWESHQNGVLWQSWGVVAVGQGVMKIPA